MRFLLLFVACFSLPDIALGQTPNFPKLAPHVNHYNYAVPPGYAILKTAFGDLNGDGTTDAAMILEAKKPQTELRAYGGINNDFIREYQKPRMLVVYLKDKELDRYSLALQNNDFILRANEGGAAGEPLRNITIHNKLLCLYFEGGNEWRWKLNYQFKKNGKTWLLTAANSTYYDSNSGEMTDRNFDFINRTKTYTTGNIYTRNAINKQNQEVFYFTNMRTLDSFKKPWTWEMDDDSYL